MGDAGSARLLSQERTAWNSSLGTVKVTARAVPSEEPHPIETAGQDQSIGAMSYVPHPVALYRAMLH